MKINDEKEKLECLVGFFCSFQIHSKHKLLFRKTKLKYNKHEILEFLKLRIQQIEPVNHKNTKTRVLLQLQLLITKLFANSYNLMIDLFFSSNEQ